MRHGARFARIGALYFGRRLQPISNTVSCRPTASKGLSRSRCTNMNRIVTTFTRLAGVATFAVGAVACETEKSLTPTSPNVAGPIAGVSITAPAPVWPANGMEVLNTEPLRLVFGNANSNSERKFWYVVELAADAGFNTRLYTAPRVDPAAGQQTTVTVDAKLGAEATYYWRVKADDGANASAYSSTAHFDIVVPVVIDAPTPRSPINGETTANGTPELVVNNGRVEGRAGDVTYVFEVANDQAFSSIASIALVGRSPGSTTNTHPSAPLPTGKTLFWRVTATNGRITSPPSVVQSFKTPAAAPGPGPGPGPGPLPPSGNCATLNTPEAILHCNRARYSSMGPAEIVEFLRQVARDLNKAGIAGGPYGILVKTSGSNCFGYSCDIICSGQGGGQRQFDVLIDAGGANGITWHEVGPGQTVRPCEIQ
jgi:hypothetical protein